MIECSAGPIDPKTKRPTGRPFKFRIHSGQASIFLVSDDFQVAESLSQVVKGWDEGVSQLSLGEKARIIMSPGMISNLIQTYLKSPRVSFHEYFLQLHLDLMQHLLLNVALQVT